MPETEPEVTAGARANTNFIASMQEQHPELAELVPEQCSECSSAWLHALRDRVDRLTDCPGREEVTAEITGKLVTRHFCRLP